MSRLLLGAAVAIAAVSGCASPARYVERNADSGVIAIPANSDMWPGYNRSAAIEKIQAHVGPHYEIIEEREVPVGSTTSNNRQVNTEETVNPLLPFLGGERQSITDTTTTRDVTEYRIAYRRVANPYGGQFGGVQQTQFLPSTSPTGVQNAGGVMPLGPGVQNAGGVPGVDGNTTMVDLSGGCASGNCADGSCTLGSGNR